MQSQILILLLLWANLAQSQKSSFDLTAVRQHIDLANQRYGERFQTNDPRFYEERYTEDACILPEETGRICGREAIRAYYYNDGQNQGFRLTINALEISGGPAAVVEEGTYELTDTSGKVLDKGKFITTWVQEKKTWKLRREIWTTDLPPAPAAEASGYDEALAKQLGADEYGMKHYVLVLLKTGPANITHKPTVDSLFAGHMANIGRLAEAGKLVLAGPIGRKEKYRGLFVFETDSKEEAAALCASDPAVAAGLLEPEIMPYFGSAALKMVNKWHERVQKRSYGN